MWKVLGKENNKSVTNNMAWSVVERITSQGLSTIVSIVLARILLPEDYAPIALVNVYVNLISVVVTSGFASALIYDHHQSTKKYSTALYSVVILTGILYWVVFLIAPFLASYYKDESLVLILRVLSFLFVLQGIQSILLAYVSKNMLFKKTYKATFFGALAGATVALILALRGFGVWALVYLPLVETTVATVILWKSLRFRIIKSFDTSYVKFMIGYSIKFVLVDFLNALYSSINSLIIAKKYTKSDLSFYTKAYNLPQMLLGSINTAISKVLFPVFSESQNEREQIKNKLQMSIQLSGYVLFPMLVGLMMISESAVVFLFTENWLGMVPYLRIMCLVWLFQPIQICAIQAYKAIGKGNSYFKVEVYKKIISIGVLIILLRIINNPIAIAWSALAGQIISCIMNMPYLKRWFSYTFIEQILDIGKNLVLCVVMCIGIYFIGWSIEQLYLKMFVQIVVGILLYIGTSALTKNKSFHILVSFLPRNKNAESKADIF